jgi:transcriptional regulator with XRE-family HTH domain
MKRTSEDDAFAADFGRVLNLKYAEAKRAGTTDQNFAESIGVERAQLDKYLRGEAVPSIRTVALAFREHNISVAYRGIKTNRAISGKPNSRRAPSQTQLLLPFSIRSEGTENIEVKFRPLGTRNFQLELTIRNRQ